MQVTIEEISPVEKRLAVQIEWPLVSARLDEAYRELGKGVTLKGFRKGKVPRNILERMFARQVEGEVQQKLVQESFFKAVQDHSIAPVVEPVVDSMKLEKGTGFQYSARVEVRAAFEPVDYFGVELTRGVPEVSDEEVERALLAKQRELTEFKKIEGRETLAAGDMAFVDIAGEVGAHPVKREAVMVDVGATTAGEAMPGLGLALVGVGLHATDHELIYTLPAAPEAAAGAGGQAGQVDPVNQGPAEMKDIAGQEARVKVTVRETREKHVPALDDDFAKDTGDADTLDELRGKLKERIATEKQAELDLAMRGELIKKVLEKNQFAVAPALVDRQSEMMVHRAKLHLARQGIDTRTVQLDETRLKQSFRPAAVEEVRSIFLIDAVATKEKVEVSDVDLEKKLADLAKERGKNVPRLKAELQKEGKLDQIREQLREEKTLDLLMSRAIITMAP